MILPLGSPRAVATRYAHASAPARQASPTCSRGCPSRSRSCRCSSQRACCFHRYAHSRPSVAGESPNRWASARRTRPAALRQRNRVAAPWSPLALLPWPSPRHMLAAVTRPAIRTRCRRRRSPSSRQPWATTTRDIAATHRSLRPPSPLSSRLTRGTSSSATRSWNCRWIGLCTADQRFTFLRPFRAGDVVIATVAIDKVRIRAGSELVSATVDMSDRDGEPICTAQATFYHAREGLA